MDKLTYVKTTDINSKSGEMLLYLSSRVIYCVPFFFPYIKMKLISIFQLRG